MLHVGVDVLVARCIDTLDAQSNLAIFIVIADDLALYVLPLFKDVTHIAYTVCGELGDVNETLDVLIKPNESAILYDLVYRNLEDRSDWETLLNGGPWVMLKLLDTKGESLSLWINVEYDRVYGITDVVNLFWVWSTRRPGDV